MSAIREVMMRGEYCGTKRAYERTDLSRAVARAQAAWNRARVRAKTGRQWAIIEELMIIIPAWLVPSLI